MPDSTAERSCPPARIWFNKCFSSIHGVLRQLREDWGSGLFIIGSHTDENFPPLSACDQAESEPVGLEPAAYVEWCLDFCAKNRVDVFIPGRMRDEIADRRRDFSLLGTALVVAGSGETLRLLEDKGRFLEQLPEGVETHSVHRVREWTEFSKACDAIQAEGKRICFKPAVGTFGTGFQIIDDSLTPLKRLMRSESHRISMAELRGILENSGPFPEMLVMEYLDGREFSVDVLAHDGAVLAMVCRRKPFNGKIRISGTSSMTPIREGYSQVLAEEPEIEEMVRKLTLHFDLGGLFNVQFRSPAERPERPRLLEINGRMSGGLPYIGLSGINLPLLAIQVAMRKPGSPMPEIPKPRLPLSVQERSEMVVSPPPP